MGSGRRKPAARRLISAQQEPKRGVRHGPSPAPSRGKEFGPDPFGAYCLRIFWARMRRRIRFLRHFHRMWPRFFQTREERFIRRDGARVGVTVY